MGGLTAYTYTMDDNTQLSTTAYISDVVHATFDEHFDTIKGAINYLQALFDDNLWYASISYFSNDVPDYGISDMKRIFPNTTKINYANNTIVWSDDKSVSLGFLINVTSSDTIYTNAPVYRENTTPTIIDTTPSSIFWFSSQYSNNFNGHDYFDTRLILFPSTIVDNNKLDLSSFSLKAGYYRSPRYYILTVRLEYNTVTHLFERVRVVASQAPTLYITPTQYNYWNGREVPDPFLPPDPYAPGGTSTGGGGGGSFDGSSTPVAHPSLPNLEVVDTGFLTLYSPSVTQVKAMADYLWSDGFSLDDFKKIFADPMEAILSLHAVPVSPATGGLKEVKLGNVATGVYMPSVSSQWVQVSCGALTLPEYWGAYLDYNPYTTLQLYLPYIGTISVSADDVIGKPLSLQYNFDVLSGACAATLMSNGTVLYNLQGSGVMQIPFTSLTYGNLLSALTQLAGTALAVGTTIGIGAATGGVGLAPAIGAFGAGVGGVASAEVNAQKQSIAHGGAISGTSGFMGIQVPYFILSRPFLCLPEKQNEFIGYPSYITVSLSDISGYTEVDSIHLEGVPATDSELAEITRLLQQGVIF